MKKSCATKYHFFRIYLTSILFYFFILSSVFFYAFMRTAPEVLLATDIKMIDLTKTNLGLVECGIESEIERGFHQYYSNNKSLDLVTTLLLALLIMGTIGGWIMNRPFKKFFQKLKKGKDIPDKLRRLCKKRLHYTPIMNGGLLFICFTIAHILLVILLFNIDKNDVVMRNATLLYLVVSLVSSTLSALFVYNWQKHRVRHNYIDKIFSAEELREVRCKRFDVDRIKNKLLFTNTLTIFLPLIIIIFYLIKSIDVISDLSSLSASQLAILMGDFAPVIRSLGIEELLIKNIHSGDSGFSSLIYISSINTIQMLLGIFSGLTVTLIYVFLYIKWTTIDIVCPIKDLLKKMQKVSEGELDSFAIVRANDEIGEVTAGFNRMLKGLQERERLKSLFGQYLTREISEEILKGNVNLGGDLYEATVMFTDIRNFTSISERISPVEVVSFLNEYLDRMIDVILKYNGIIDKFIGDGILAIFGVPIRSESHQKEAVMAAMAMQEELAKMNRERERRGDFPINIGIGIHSGSLIAGNIGNSKKLEYTVIGDTVNIASRVEKLTKEYMTGILVSETTYSKLNSDFKEELGAEEIRDVSIRGKEGQFNLYKIDRDQEGK